MSHRLAGIWATVCLLGVVVAGCDSAITQPQQPPPPPLTVVTVTPIALTLGVGQTKQLLANVIRPGPIAPGVLWTTSDATVAQVSSIGVVTARKIGVAEISARAGSATGTASVTVQD